eukprot:1266748-Pyramimonas_sp.AAC.1
MKLVGCQPQSGLQHAPSVQFSVMQYFANAGLSRGMAAMAQKLVKSTTTPSARILFIARWLGGAVAVKVRASGP